MTRRRTDSSTRRRSSAVVGASVSRPELPFDMPDRATLRASPRKVFAHYFATDVGPISLDNVGPPAADYYDTYFMPPGRLETFPGALDRTPVGGLVRDRPIRRPNISTGYQQADRRTDVQQAYDANLDGFVVDVLGLSGSTSWTRSTGIYDAVAELGLVGKFDCLPMFDMTGLTTQTASDLANATATLAGKAASYAPGGRVQVTWFKPEQRALQFYVDYRAACTALGLTIDNTFCYVNTTQTTAPGLNAEAARHGRWGDRDPVACNDAGVQNRGGAQWIKDSYNKPYMAPVAPGDIRPNTQSGNNYHEQIGLSTLDTSWDAAIFGNGTANGQADWVQQPTYNDYSETANIGPSLLHGFALLDYQSWRLVRYKTGAYPTVTRNALYLSHRSQFVNGMTWTASTFNNPMELSGSTTAVDVIEVRAFATGPATVLISRGTGATAVASSHSVTAGLNTITVPLVAGPAGSVSARMSTDGGATTVPGTLITSPWAVSHTAMVHDPVYRIGSSLRGWSAIYPSLVPTQNQAIT